MSQNIFKCRYLAISAVIENLNAILIHQTIRRFPASSLNFVEREGNKNSKTISFPFPRILDHVMDKKILFLEIFYLSNFIYVDAMTRSISDIDGCTILMYKNGSICNVLNTNI